MALDKQTVAKVAHLARIKVPEERLESLAGELDGIVNWVEQLGEVDVDGVAPMTSAVETSLRWREDVVDDGGYPEKATANAPDAQMNFYTTPKVVE